MFINIWEKVFGRASIRIFFPVMGALLIALLLAACILGYSLQVIYNNSLAAAREHSARTGIADELRITSDELTRLMRLYAATGNKQYLADYQTVQDIRSGKAPRPAQYKYIYWSLLPEHRDERHPPSESAPLMESLQELRLLQNERTLLLDSILKARQLEEMDAAAAALVAQAETDGGDAAAALAAAREQLFSEEYAAKKHEVMLPLDVFYDLADKRYASGSDAIHRRTDGILTALTVVLGLFLFLVALMILFVHHKVLSPVNHMLGNIRRIRSGQEIERRVFYSDEIGLLMRQFYSMKEQMDRSFQELEAVSFTDSLTGLYNRYYFNQVSRKQMLLAARNKQVMCLLICDIDHFKQVNDQHGHLAGDIALKHVAGLIAGGVRESDICARYGGEEFLLMLSNAGAESGMAVAEKVRAAVESSPCDIGDGKFLNLTASFGVAEMQGTDNINDVIDLADKALYEAKNNGRNQVQLGQPG